MTNTQRKARTVKQLFMHLTRAAELPKETPFERRDLCRQCVRDARGRGDYVGVAFRRTGDTEYNAIKCESCGATVEGQETNVR